MTRQRDTHSSSHLSLGDCDVVGKQERSRDRTPRTNTPEGDRSGYMANCFVEDGPRLSHRVQLSSESTTADHAKTGVIGERSSASSHGQLESHSSGPQLSGLVGI
jgi:hypothetical protein